MLSSLSAKSAAAYGSKQYVVRELLPNTALKYSFKTHGPVPYFDVPNLKTVQNANVN